MGANPSLDRSGYCGYDSKFPEKQVIRKRSKKSDYLLYRPQFKVPDYQPPVKPFRRNASKVCQNKSDVSIPHETDSFSVPKIPQQDNNSDSRIQDKLTSNRRCRENWFQHSENKAMGSNPSWDTSGSYEEMLSSLKKQAISKMSKKSDSFKHQPRAEVPDYQLPVNSYGQNTHRIFEDESNVSIPFEADFFSVRGFLQQDNISETTETTTEKILNPIVDECPLEDVFRADAKFFPVDKIILQDNMSESSETSAEETKNPVVAVCPFEDVLRADAKSFPVDKTIQQNNMSEARETSAEETKNPVVETCPFEDVLYKFYTDKILTDIVLQANSELFHVHKLVLRCRSAVFSDMFKDYLNAETSKYVDIAEDADTLRHLLLYIYTNELKEMQWQNAADLFKAADKYELLDLKKQCSIILKSKISRNNFCDILSLADMHHGTELLEAVLDFISQIPDIFCSEAWKLFKRENSELALNITERIINNFRIPI